MTANSVGSIENMNSASGTLARGAQAEQLSRNETARAETREKSMVRLGGWVTLIQWLSVLVTLVVVIAWGAEPTTADAYFTVLREDRAGAILRMDFPTLINIALFTVTAFCLFVALRRQNETVAMLAMLLAFAGVIMAVSAHSAFSMLYLDTRYTQAATDAQRAQLLAAGDAIIAGNIWNSTSGNIAGIFLQGAFVVFSLLMLRTKRFGKMTAYTGIVAHGLDWLHIPVLLFPPSVAVAMLAFAGMVYLIWYPLLARDLLRLARPDVQM